MATSSNTAISDKFSALFCEGMSLDDLWYVRNASAVEEPVKKERWQYCPYCEIIKGKNETIFLTDESLWHHLRNEHQNNLKVETWVAIPLKEGKEDPLTPAMAEKLREMEELITTGRFHFMKMDIIEDDVADVGVDNTAVVMAPPSPEGDGDAAVDDSPKRVVRCVYHLEDDM